MRESKLWILFLAFIAVSITISLIYQKNVHNLISPHTTRLLSQSQLSPDSPASFRLITFQAKTNQPIPQAKVDIHLQGKSLPSVRLFQGETDQSGTLAARFQVPDWPEGEEYQLAIATASAWGKDTIQRTISLKRRYKMLLTTDKPFYQPSQTLHLRALVQDSANRKPGREQSVTFEVFDASETRLFKKETKTSKFGIVSADFQLADEINLGRYTVKATCKESVAERKVTVDRYVLPKFSLDLKTDRAYYAPGQKLTGRLEARYYFGKPLAAGRVRIFIPRADGKETAIQGQTDSSGRFQFSHPLPDYAAGTELDAGQARVAMRVEVSDSAGQSASITRPLILSAEAYLVTAVPENRYFVAGVSNLLYLAVSYPDGQPVPGAEIRIKGANESVKANQLGIATLKVSDSDLQALPDESSYDQTAKGRATMEVEVRESGQPWKTYPLPLTYAMEEIGQGYYDLEQVSIPMILRPDKVIYQAGETAHIEILTSEPGTYYLDVVHSGQTVLTRALEIPAGRGHIEVPLSQQETGTLHFTVYKLLAEGHIVRTSLPVSVVSAEGLKVHFKAEKASFRPGEQTVLKLKVTGPDGQAAPSALGLSIVDKSVYGLFEQHPGMEMTAFALEQDLAQPRYQIFYDGPRLMNLPEPDRQTALRFVAAQGSVSQVEATPRPYGSARWRKSEKLRELKDFSLSVNTLQDKSKQAAMLEQELPAWRGAALLGLILLAMAVLCLLSLVILLRRPQGSLSETGQARARSHLFFLGFFILLVPGLGLTGLMVEHFAPLVLVIGVLVAGSAGLMRLLIHIEGRSLPAEANALYTLCKQFLLTLSLLLLSPILCAVPLLIINIFAYSLSQELWPFYWIGTLSLGVLMLFLHGRCALRLAACARERRALNRCLRLWLVGPFGFLLGLAWLAFDHLGNFIIYLLGGGLLFIASLLLIFWSLRPVIQPFSPPAGPPDRFLKWKILLPLWAGAVVMQVGQNQGWDLSLAVLSGIVTAILGGLGVLLGQHFQNLGQLVLQVRKSDGLAASLLTMSPALAVLPLLTVLLFVLSAWTQNSDWRLTILAFTGDWSGPALLTAGGLVIVAYSLVRIGIQKTCLGFQGKQLRSSVLPALLLPVVVLMLIFISLPNFIGAQDRAKSAGRQPRHTLEEESAPAAGQPGYVRQYFPETLLFEPQVITDDQGEAEIPLKLADSITTWKVSGMASNLQGELGSVEAEILVFQDFFADLDLPVSLTQGDEVSIPVILYNYRDTAQSVQVQLEPNTAFQLQGPAKKQVGLAPQGVQVAYFPVKFVAHGRHKLVVQASSGGTGDALAREIEVLPRGQRVNFVQNGVLRGASVQEIGLPPGIVPGSATLALKVYPGYLSQVVEGLENIFKMPYGCFEQTSSTTYPNALVLDYLQKNNHISPELRLKAEGYLNYGYQRLVGFEVAGGGFSLYGDAPADPGLTAYGLLEFTDMSKVFPVDEKLIERTARWLLDQDWKGHETYIAWALSQTKYSTDPAMERVMTTLAETYLSNGSNQQLDNYHLALLANAYVAREPHSGRTGQLLEALYRQRQEEGAMIFWENAKPTYYYGAGPSGQIETTALALYAFMQAGRYRDVMAKGLEYLTQNRDPEGTWHTTQATILTLRLILALEADKPVPGTLTARLNGQAATEPIVITPENQDVLQRLNLSPYLKGSRHTVELGFSSDQPVAYQLTGSYYALPPKIPQKKKPLQLELSYDRSRLRVNDTLTAALRVRFNGARPSSSLLLDLGIPAGFEILAQDLENAKASGKIEKYTLTGRQLTIYLKGMAPGQVFQLKYRLKARFPVRISTPAARVYEYYQPENEDRAREALLEVI